MPQEVSRQVLLHTVNRDDLNGAKNIALIGFSSLAAQDDLALPPFRRSRNTNK